MSFENQKSAPDMVPAQSESHLRLADEALSATQPLMANMDKSMPTAAVPSLEIQGLNLGKDAVNANLLPSTDDASAQSFGRHHHHGPYPYPFGHPVGHPTSHVNALQYRVHDGKITIVGR